MGSQGLTETNSVENVSSLGILIAVESTAKVDRLDESSALTKTAGVDYAAFVDNEEKIFAVRAAFIELSEAAIRLGTAAETLCSGMPWNDIRGIGNHLRHGYDRIDLERLWNTMTEDLPLLRQAATAALRQLRNRPAEPNRYNTVSLDEAVVFTVSLKEGGVV